MTTLIGHLKTENDTIAEKSEMGIRRMRLIITGRHERLHRKLEESAATIWAQWSKQVEKLQLIRADVANRKKTEFDIYHRPGVQHAVVDYLSRLESREAGDGVQDEFPDAGDATARKIWQSGLWWPTTLKDAIRYGKECDLCQRLGQPTEQARMPHHPVSCEYSHTM